MTRIKPNPDRPKITREEARRIARESLAEISDAEDAALTAAAEADPDNPPADALFERRKGGRPKSDNPKKSVSMRLDAELVDVLKAGGPGWQTRANAALRKAFGLK